jgi:hypothetical protein
MSKTEEIAKTLPLKEAYGDIARPMLQPVGGAVGSLLRFVALPFTFLGMTAEQLENRYRAFIEKAFQRVPEEKRVMPKPSVAGPLLEHAKYVFEDEPDLEEMFLALLSSAMNADTAETCSPTFVETLKRMSGFDARVLKEVSVEIELINSIVTLDCVVTRLTSRLRYAIL